MPNVIQLRGGPHLRCASPPSESNACILDPDETSAAVTLRTTVVEEVRRSVLLLDLAAQRLRLIAAEALDEQSRQALTGQLDNIERQLEVAREMARRL